MIAEKRQVSAKSRDYVVMDNWITTDEAAVIGPKPDEDRIRRALEAAYYSWWAENDHALSMGHPGDVLALRLRLNAAFANSRKSSSEASRAS